MKITNLTAENFKRIKAVDITPDGSLVQITGRNGNGKSSVLDAIESALGGACRAPAEPVRAGEERARIVCTLDGGSLVVRRTFTPPGGGSLVVENAEGAKYGSPQAVLDKLVGTLTFDPLAFARLSPKQQAETLCGVLGVDLEADRLRRANLYALRTVANRRATQMKHQINPADDDPSLPDQEVSAADLFTAIQKADATNAKRDEVERRRVQMVRDLEERKREVAKARAAIEAMEASLTTRESDLNEYVSRMKTLAPKIDTAPMREQLAAAEDLNGRIRLRDRQRELFRQATEADAESAELTAAIEAIDAAQRERLSSSAIPVDGLALTESGVTLNGVPFSQASSAERIRASAAIGLAMNPKLRVLLVRDGSLLDSEGLAELADFAATNEAQVWVERVTDGEAVGIVIEDGMVDGSGDR